MRPATADDGPALAELLFRNPQAGRMLIGQRRADPFARGTAFPEAATWVVAGDDGEPEAAVSAARKDVLVGGAAVVAGYVFDLVVDGRARGRGLARRLLEAAEEWARERGAALLYATVIGGNAASLAVFRAAGYRVTLPMAMRLFPVFRDRPDEPAPDADWTAAAQRLRDEARVHDLFPQALLTDPHAVWRGLPGWREEDAWVTGGATLALWDHRAVTLPIPLRLPVELRLLAASGRAARALRIPFPSPPVIGEPELTGYLLSGGGHDADLRAALRAALARARTRGLDLVVLPHPADARPAWSRAAFSIGERYDLVAKPLDPGLGHVGMRPVWADPTDL